MEIGLDKNDLKNIDYIINHFVENNNNNNKGLISISSLGFCLQKLIDGREELAGVLGGEEDD